MHQLRERFLRVHGLAVVVVVVVVVVVSIDLVLPVLFLLLSADLTLLSLVWHTPSPSDCCCCDTRHSSSSTTTTTTGPSSSRHVRESPCCPPLSRPCNLCLDGPVRAGWTTPCSDVLTRPAGIQLCTLRRGRTRSVAFPSVTLACSHVPVVLLNAGPSTGKIAVIAEIIDHNRVTSLFPAHSLAHPLPGSNRRPHHLRPPPILPLPPSLPHPPPSHHAPPRGWLRRHPQTTRKRGHRRQVGELGVGKETRCHPEAALAERLCTLRGHVGEKGEKGRRPQGPGQGMSVVASITHEYIAPCPPLPFRVTWPSPPPRHARRPVRPLCVPRPARLLARAHNTQDRRPPALPGLPPPLRLVFRRSLHQRSRNRPGRPTRMQSLPRRRCLWGHTHVRPHRPRSILLIIDTASLPSPSRRGACSRTTTRSKTSKPPTRPPSSMPSLTRCAIALSITPLCSPRTHPDMVKHRRAQGRLKTQSIPSHHLC